MHIVKIPDELLKWGKSPVSTRFARPWATELERLSARQISDEREFRELMSNFEALCVEAVRANRPELLDGVDLLSAEYIGLKYKFEFLGKQIGVGHGERYSWSELRGILETDDPESALMAVDRAKTLLEQAFPHARLQVHDAREVQVSCSACQTTTSRVMLDTAQSSLCGPCWVTLTDAKPLTFKRKR